MTLLAKLRGYFLAGILISAPIYVTISIATWFIDFVDNSVLPLVPVRYNPDLWLQDTFGLPFSVPGFGLIILLALLTLLGALTAGFVGRSLIRIGEQLLGRMPIIRTLYSASKQIIETVLKNQSQAFKQAVLIQYPRPGVWAVGFVTSTTSGELQTKLTGTRAESESNDTPCKLVNIFLPTTPNPTSGFLLFVPEEDVIFLDMSIEDAVKMIISAGIVVPDYQTSGSQTPPSNAGTKPK